MTRVVDRIWQMMGHRAAEAMRVNLEGAIIMYGFDPSKRAARPWLWSIYDGDLYVIAPAGNTYDEDNYKGRTGPMLGGAEYCEHIWAPLDD